jgi:hypothetical protein
MKGLYMLYSKVHIRETALNEWHLLLTCEFGKHDFVLMQSSNSDRFQLTALTLEQTACWPFEKAGEKRKQSNSVNE